MGRLILKTPEEIEKLHAANRIVAKALALAESMIAPGVTTGEIDRAVETLIRDHGATPAFLGYPAPSPKVKPYPASICASLNEEVVHGIPGSRILREGDILSVDIGTELEGWFGDAARTFPVGAISDKARALLDTCRLCLERAIQEMRPGVRLSTLCATIQKTAESRGYSVVTQFVGHGIGRAMHEGPQIPNHVFRGMDDPVLPVGSVLAIEPMVNVGGSDVLVLSDGWTVATRDKSLSAHFEDSVAMTERGPRILSRM